jgi:hypothetical protein
LRRGTEFLMGIAATSPAYPCDAEGSAGSAQTSIGRTREAARLDRRGRRRAFAAVDEGVRLLRFRIHGGVQHAVIGQLHFFHTTDSLQQAPLADNWSDSTTPPPSPPPSRLSFHLLCCIPSSRCRSLLSFPPLTVPA